MVEIDWINKFDLFIVCAGAMVDDSSPSNKSLLTDWTGWFGIVFSWVRAVRSAHSGPLHNTLNQIKSNQIESHCKLHKMSWAVIKFILENEMIGMNELNVAPPWHCCVSSWLNWNPKPGWIIGNLFCGDCVPMSPSSFRHQSNQLLLLLFCPLSVNHFTHSPFHRIVTIVDPVSLLAVSQLSV